MIYKDKGITEFVDEGTLTDETTVPVQLTVRTIREARKLYGEGCIDWRDRNVLADDDKVSLFVSLDVIRKLKGLMMEGVLSISFPGAPRMTVVEGIDDNPEGIQARMNTMVKAFIKPSGEPSPTPILNQTNSSFKEFEKQILNSLGIPLPPREGDYYICNLEYSASYYKHGDVLMIENVTEKFVHSIDANNELNGDCLDTFDKHFERLPTVKFNQEWTNKETLDREVFVESVVNGRVNFICMSTSSFSASRTISEFLTTYEHVEDDFIQVWSTWNDDEHGEVQVKAVDSKGVVFIPMNNYHTLQTVEKFLNTFVWLTDG